MSTQLAQHLIELRRRLIWVVLGFGLVFALLFPYSNQIYTLLAAPLTKYMSGKIQLVATEITAPVVVPLKLTAGVAFILSLPNSLYQLWQFVAPGLYRHERKLILGVISTALLLFSSGVLFCYFLVLPTLFHFISSYKAPQIALLADIEKYLSLILNLFMIFGCAFQTPLIVLLLIYFKILNPAQAKSMRKYVLVACFIVAAIVTPPDVLSQTLLALPLYALYEIGVLAGNYLTPQPSSYHYGQAQE